MLTWLHPDPNKRDKTTIYYVSYRLFEVYHPDNNFIIVIWSCFTVKKGNSSELQFGDTCSKCIKQLGGFLKENLNIFALLAVI